MRRDGFEMSYSTAEEIEAPLVINDLNGEPYGDNIIDLSIYRKEKPENDKKSGFRYVRILEDTVYLSHDGNFDDPDSIAVTAPRYLGGKEFSHFDENEEPLYELMHFVNDD
jgi:hypothetical protein